MTSLRRGAYRAATRAFREVLEEYDVPPLMIWILLTWLRIRMAWFLWTKRLPVLPGTIETVIVPRMREAAKKLGVDWYWARKTWRG